MKGFKDVKGFTLIELLITTALIGLVITGGMRLYYFSDRALMLGSAQADLQAEMHQAMHRITEEVRLAHSLKIAASKEQLDAELAEQSEEQDTQGFIIYGEDGSVFIEKPEKVALLDRNVLQTDYALHFEPVYHNSARVPDLLGIRLVSQTPGLEFELKSQVQVLNLRETGIQGEHHGTAIYFTKTFSEEDLEEARRIRPGCIMRRYVYAADAPELEVLRRFRDERLARHPVGRVAIRTYYAASTALISLVEAQPWAEAPIQAIFKGAAHLVLRFA